MTLSAEKIPALKTRVLEEMEKRKIIGLTYGLILDGQVACLQGCGWADRENKIPVTEETMFRLASVTKPIAAVAAMQLAEQGSLDLDVDVRRYVPEFTDHGVTITTRHLLNHQSGLPHYTKDPWQNDTGQPVDPIRVVELFKNEPLLFKPGEKCAYSSYGYMLLSAVIQRASGKNFADQIKERIAQPSGAATLQPDYQAKDIPHRATGYRLHEGQITFSTNTDQSWKWGAGNYIATIGDVTKFAEALLQNKLLSPETLRQMWSTQKTTDGQLSAIVYGGITTPYGLGFQLQLDKQNQVLKPYHTGGQEKTRTRLVLYPALNTAMVVMSNCEWANPAFFSTLIYGLLSNAEQVRPHRGTQ